MPHWGWLGTDGSGGGAWYLFYSGVFGVLVIAAGLFWNGLLNYRLHNCKRAWCWRIGHHELMDPEDGVTRRLCWKHHPDVQHRVLHREHIERIQKRAHLYLGGKPGKG